MKNLMTVFLVLTMALPAMARQQFPKKAKPAYGSQCGLTDLYGDDSWRESGKGIDLRSASPSTIAQLPTIIKQQLIIAAHHQGEEQNLNTLGAVEFFREFSEGGDLSISHFRVNGELFTQVLFYPGGNPGGSIFRYGQLRIIADISDSDVVCVK